MLAKEQFDQIQRDYDQKQLDALYRNDQYLQALYTKIPRLKAIKEELASLQVGRIKARLISTGISDEEYEKRIQALLAEQEALYQSNGIHKEDLLPHYSCPDCKDTGFIRPGVRCHCYTQAVIDILSTQSGMASMLNDHTFADFNYDLFDDTTVDPSVGMTARANMKDIVSYCHKFIDEFKTVPRSIILQGKSGVGKTFLTNCIANEILKRSYSVLYLSAIDFSQILTDIAFHNKDVTSETRFQADYIFNCDLLIIDDLGTEVTNSYKSSNLFNCLDKRINTNKSTIISTNLSARELREIYSERIFSRIIGNFTYLKLFGADLRSRS